MQILIAAGGTGGHIYPALAVARALTKRTPPPELHWIGGHRGLEAGIVPGTGVPLTRLLLRSLRTVDLSVAAAVDPLRLSLSYPQALALLGRRRPAAIFTTGGYVSLPVAMAAATLRIPMLVWEGNVVPGRSTRVVARLAACSAVSFVQTCRTLRDPCFRTGTPIRDLAGTDSLAARRRFEVPADARCLLLFGGSQAVARFDAAVDQALPELIGRAVVLHVTGEEGFDAALARRERLAADIRPRYRPYPFLRDEMYDAYAAADLVVGRAGSSTIAETTAFGIPLVVVPYPHAAAHQAANARMVEEAGAGWVIPDEAFDGAALVEAMAILGDPRRHLEMSAASRDLGRPGAADAVAELVLALAERRPLPGPDEIERLSRVGEGVPVGPAERSAETPDEILDETQGDAPGETQRDAPAEAPAGAPAR
jgi:UDP-N-acetylglucosamine--N-acetylmuramyl-(pentapeptide) pyrophosphoryl-undecaprenol N-acetylglucosamine transferase